MTIDKRALREVAEKATKGPWKVFSDIDTKTFSIHTPRDKRCENVIKWGGFDCQPNAEANAEFIAAFNPKVALALLDENIQLQREKDAIEAVALALALRDDMRQAREQLEVAEHTAAVDHEAACSLVEENEELKRKLEAENQRNTVLTAKIEPMDRRIAELERSETQLINERDSAESALNDAYKAVMGQAPEWSNWFSFENAIDEIELVCELWRNQTDDVIQFRQRIQELEAKLANPVLLPKTNGYWNEQEKAYEEAITLAKRQVRLAGFSVEDM
ncbi:ead/Ea22-like family protein [Salmonella enterica subsp. diarizonae]|nr:ead/Ea22-like family protein [Salmonella enterica subsp. diarizonae]